MICSSCSHAYHWSCLGPAHPSSKRKRRDKWQCFACSRVEVSYSFNFSDSIRIP
jgi:hypothetical protein